MWKRMEKPETCRLQTGQPLLLPPAAGRTPLRPPLSGAFRPQMARVLAPGPAPRSAPGPAPRSSRLCARLRGAELRALHTPVPLCQPPPRRPQSGRRARAAIAPSAFCGRRHQLHLRWLRNQAQSPQPSGTVSQPREASSEHRVPSAAWCCWLGGLGPTAGCGPPLRAPGFCRPHVCPLLLQPEGSQLPPLSPSSPCAFLALQ